MGDVFSETLVASGLEGTPLFLAANPGDADRAFVVEKSGDIRILDLVTGAVAARPFLDVSSEISTEGEKGLLGLAFDPGYAANGRFYVFLSNQAGDSEIREYTRSAADPGQADPTTVRPVLTIPQPPGSSVHRGGWLGFGPDGFLYVTTGDGSEPANAPDTESLLGKVLRINVHADDFPADPGRNYAIPLDNPFVGGSNPGADEVWAYGFRNPWRASFDSATGHLFLGDVGEHSWEEIDVISAAGSYGWPFFEGPARFQATPEFPATGFVFPISAYSHDSGDGGTVIGGYVYRGPGEALQGQYVFGDFLSGKIWSLSDANGDGNWERTQLASPTGAGAGSLDHPTGFGQDAVGRLYATDADGEVFRFEVGAIAAQVARLYDAALGRLPDVGGMTYWRNALEAGSMSLKAIAAGFTGSAEFQGKYGALDDAAFVTALYHNALHREPDAPGLASWTNAMAHGMSRSDVVLGFSESAEHMAMAAPHALSDSGILFA